MLGPGDAVGLNIVQAALAQAAELIHPDPIAEISLAVDASKHHVSGVLQQWSGSTQAPLAFFSRKLTEVKAHFSTFDKEMLDCMAASKALQVPARGAEVLHLVQPQATHLRTPQGVRPVVS